MPYNEQGPNWLPALPQLSLKPCSDTTSGRQIVTSQLSLRLLHQGLHLHINNQITRGISDTRQKCLVSTGWSWRYRILYLALFKVGMAGTALPGTTAIPGTYATGFGKFQQGTILMCPPYIDGWALESDIEILLPFRLVDLNILGWRWPKQFGRYIVFRHSPVAEVCWNFFNHWWRTTEIKFIISGFQHFRHC